MSSPNSKSSETRCRCAHAVRPEVVQNILSGLERLPLPENPVEVSPLNPVGSIINALLEARHDLNRQYDAIERHRRQVAGDPEVTPLECEEVHDLIDALNTAGYLAFQWADLSYKAFQAVQSVAVEDPDSEDPSPIVAAAEQSFNTLRDEVEPIMKNQAQLPQVIGSDDDVFDIIESLMSRGGAGGVAVFRMSRRPTQG